jgi:hypothetical protein
LLFKNFLLKAIFDIEAVIFVAFDISFHVLKSKQNKFAKTRALWPDLSTTMNLKQEEQQFQSQTQMKILHGKFCVTSNFVHSVFLNHGHKNNANDHKQLCYHKARCFHRRSITSVTIPA